MFWKSLKLSIAVILIASYMVLLFGEGYAATPTVKLVVDPDTTDVYVGSEPISLTAEASGSGLTFRWELRGPGKLEGTGSAMFYTLPDKIEGESARAIITVTVTDEAGQETIEGVTFTILARKTPAQEESPKPTKKGMSKTTKIALGVGAAAALGGGIALLAGGGDDDNGGGPFSGTFRAEYTTEGGQVYWIDVYKLTQNDSSITGTNDMTGTTSCCTASFTVPITGTATETSATISSPYGEGRCEGIDCAEKFYVDAYTANAELINDGNTLRIYWYDWVYYDYGRTAKLIYPETGTQIKEDKVFIGNRDFIRQ